jgi:hypothetical protein
MEAGHIHKYMRFKFPKGRTAFKCASCPHYVFPNMIVGRSSICWRCGMEFIMDERASKLKKPHCDCRKRQLDKVLELVKEDLTIPAERGE